MSSFRTQRRVVIAVKRPALILFANCMVTSVACVTNCTGCVLDITHVHNHGRLLSLCTLLVAIINALTRGATTCDVGEAPPNTILGTVEC